MANLHDGIMINLTSTFASKLDLAQSFLLSLVTTNDAAEVADVAILAVLASDEMRAAKPVQTMAIAAAKAVATIFKWVVASALLIEEFMARLQCAKIHAPISEPCGRVHSEMHQKREQSLRNSHLADPIWLRMRPADCQTQD